MKKLLLFLFLMSAVSIAIAQQTSPIEQLADICLAQRAELLKVQPDPDEHFKALENCYRQLDSMQILENSPYLHPKMMFEDYDFAGHIVFSRRFLLNYLENNIDPHYTTDIPFDTEALKIKEQERDRVRGERGEYSKWIQSQNGLVDNRFPLDYSFFADPTDYQLLLIVENKNLGLQLKISEEESGRTTTLTTDKNGVITYRLQVKQKDYVHLYVSSPAPETCSFIIAVK